MLHNLFSGTPYLFYFLLTAGILIYTFVQHAETRYKLIPYLFVFGLLLFARLPAIFTNEALNPDESMQLAQALSIVRHPAVFDSWDGNTIGPLDTYLIMVPYLFGLPLDYSTLHLMAVFFHFGFWAVLFFSIKYIFGKNAAFWGTLPIVVWFVFTQHYDFLHYSSEQPPLLMLTICTYIYFVFYKNPESPVWLLFFQGILAALIPFGKLQAVPAIFVILAFTVSHLFVSFDWRKFLQKFSFLVAGGLTITGFIIALTSYWGVYDDMLLYYFEGNLFHEAGGAKTPIYQKIYNHFKFTTDLFEFKALMLNLFVLCCFFILRSNDFSRNILLFILVLTIFSVYAIAKSGFRLYHYYHFLLLPLGLLGGLFAKDLKMNFSRRIGLSIATILLFLLPIMPSMAKGEVFYSYPYKGRKLQISEVSKTILKYANSGEPLAVWGWMQNYYVETQMPQGTNDNHTIRCFTYSMVEEHRQRYIADLIKNQPPVIVDAVAPSSFLMTDRNEFGIHKFPELDAYIKANYVLAETVNQNDIYVRKDRFLKK